MSNADFSFADLKNGISNHMSLMYENEGFSPLAGKILALLLFAPEPVSLQEMAGTLGVTKAAVSVQVRTLEKQSMCNKLPTSSDRKDYYYIAPDFSMIVIASVIRKMKDVLNQIDSALHKLGQLRDISEEDVPSHNAFKRRFIEMQAMYQLFIDKLTGLEDDWQKRREQLNFNETF
ncbi:GbsR/MarR family transcriptional regulator [Paenibacillus hamazuiensis]|uniref:GbsR/MarR family transcriptional regulator n=1 Tax=Paenibacillus hamazuiensis TaxID=2936508 RepID=UPI00200F941D|nr:MarR family transcriptional regulator [Paenibacillus hamazuiensis]